MFVLPLIKGLAIGFCIAAPVGPIGVLCIRRSIAHGWRIGFLTGLGAATADAIYGAVAAFGLTAITAMLTSQQKWMSLLGGLVLLWLGWNTMRTRPPSEGASTPAMSAGGAYGSTVLLTLANPATIISFGAIYATWGFQTPSYAHAAWLTIGVLLGSAAWWLLLSGLFGLARNRINIQSMKWINRLSGALLAGFGAYAIARTAVRAGSQIVP